MSLEELLKDKAVKKGIFTLKCGIPSKYFFDIDNATTDLQCLKGLVSRLEQELQLVDFDRIVVLSKAFGPIGALPIASILSWKLDKPLIIVKEESPYNPISMVGEPKKSDKLIILEDVATSGVGLSKAISLLKNYSLDVVAVIVIFDREQGANLRIKDFRTIEYKRLFTPKELSISLD